jgi:hypothetical protein
MSIIMFKENEEGKRPSVEAFQAIAETRFQDFYQQREDIDESYQLADWMYKGGQARGIFDAERRQWCPREVDGKANMGSILAHRQVNTLAGTLGAILLSGRDLWQYHDKPTSGNPASSETGATTAAQMNALAKWIQKHDDFDKKLPEFCLAINKQSNIFAWLGMRNEETTEVGSELDVVETGEVDALTGTPLYDYERKTRVRKGIKTPFPSVRFPYPRNVYMDRFLADVQDQEFVFVLSTTTKSKLMKEGKWLDQKALAKLDPGAFEWDGNYGGTGKQEDEENAGREHNPRGLMLRWDVYARVPVKAGEMYDPAKDEEKDEDDPLKGVSYKLLWGVFVGNSMGDSVCLKLMSDFDPDDEIPLQAIRVLPDNPDMLYHTFHTDVIRPSYAADCSFLNTAVDQHAISTDPPLQILHGAHFVKDFTFKHGQRWHVKVKDAIMPLQIPDRTGTSMAMREQVRDDAKMALATDSAKLGEYAGARTSASEFLQVSQSTDMTLAMKNAYVVGQFLPWLARKYVSYAREFMPPEVLQRILNEMMFPEPKGEYIGNYDVTVDIVGQYEDDQRREMGLDRMMQILANPAFIQSQTHKLDVGELVKMYAEAKKLPVGRLVQPPNLTDSEMAARQRIGNMLISGVYQPPQPGESVEIHLRIAVAERLRWRGLEKSQDPRAVNIPLIDQYIGDLKTLIGGAGGGQEQPQEAMPGEMTPGQEAAAPAAAELGAAMGGAV